MVLDSGLPHSVLYEFFFCYCVEGSGGHHEVANDFTEFADLNLNVLEGGIAGPSPNDHDCLRVNS